MAAAVQYFSLALSGTRMRMHLRVAGLAMAAAVLYTAANELLIQPTEYTCFNLALEKIKCALFATDVLRFRAPP